MATGAGGVADDALLLMSTFQSQAALSRVAAADEQMDPADSSIDGPLPGQFGGVSSTEFGVPLTQWMVDSGWTCVHAAVWYEDESTVARLCQSIGVDVNKPTFASVTPLRLAIQRYGATHPIVRVLHEAGGHHSISKLQEGLPAASEGTPCVYAPGVDYKSVPTGFAARVRARKQFKTDAAANVAAAVQSSDLLAAASQRSAATANVPLPPALSAERQFAARLSSDQARLVRVSDDVGRHSRQSEGTADRPSGEGPAVKDVDTSELAPAAAAAAAAAAAMADDDPATSFSTSVTRSSAHPESASQINLLASPVEATASHAEAQGPATPHTVTSPLLGDADDDDDDLAPPPSFRPRSQIGVTSDASGRRLSAAEPPPRLSASVVPGRPSGAYSHGRSSAAVSARSSGVASSGVGSADEDDDPVAAARNEEAAAAAAAAAKEAAAAAEEAAKKEAEAAEQQRLEAERVAAEEVAKEEHQAANVAAQRELEAVEKSERAVLAACAQEELEDLMSLIRAEFAAAIAAAVPETDADEMWGNEKALRVVDAAISKAVVDEKVPLVGPPDVVLRALVEALPQLVKPAGVVEPVAFIRGVYAWLIGRSPFSGAKYVEAGGKPSVTATLDVDAFCSDYTVTGDPAVVASVFVNLISSPPTTPACSRLHSIKAVVVPSNSRVLGSLLSPPAPVGTKLPFTGRHAMVAVQVRSGGRVVVVDPVLSCGASVMPPTGRSNGAHLWKDRRSVLYFDPPMDVYLYLVAAAAGSNGLIAAFSGVGSSGAALPAVLQPSVTSLQDSLVWVSPSFLEDGGRVVGGCFHVDTSGSALHNDPRAAEGAVMVRVRLPESYVGRVVVDLTSSAPRSTDVILHLSAATMQLAPIVSPDAPASTQVKAGIGVKDSHPLPAALCAPSDDDVVFIGVAREATQHHLNARFTPSDGTRALSFFCAALVSKHAAQDPLSQYVAPSVDLAIARKLQLQLWSGVGSREAAVKLFAGKSSIAVSDIDALGEDDESAPYTCPVTPVTFKSFAHAELPKVAKRLVPQIVSSEKPTAKATVSLDDEDQSALLWYASLRVYSRAVATSAHKPTQWWANIVPLHTATTPAPQVRMVLPSHTVADPKASRHAPVDLANAVVRRTFVEPAFYSDLGYSVWSVTVLAPPQNGDYFLNLYVRDATQPEAEFERVVSVVVRDRSAVAPPQDYLPPVPPWTDLFERRISLLTDVRWVVGTSNASGAAVVKVLQDAAEHRSRASAAATAATLLGSTHDLELDVYGPEREPIDPLLPEADVLNSSVEGPPMLLAGQCFQSERPEMEESMLSCEVLYSHEVPGAVELWGVVSLVEDEVRDDELLQVWCVSVDCVENPNAQDGEDVPLQPICSFYVASFVEFDEKPPQSSFLPGVTEVNLAAASLGVLAVTPLSPILVCHPLRGDVHRRDLVTLQPSVPEQFEKKYFTLGVSPAYDKAAMLSNDSVSSDVIFVVIAPRAIVSELVVVLKGPVADPADLESAPSAPTTAYILQVVAFAQNNVAVLVRVIPPERGRYVVLLARSASTGPAKVVARWQLLAAAEASETFIHTLRVPDAHAAILAPIHTSIPVGEAIFVVETENVTGAQVKLVSGHAVDLQVLRKEGRRIMYGGALQVSAGACSLIVHCGKARYEIATWTGV